MPEFLYRAVRRDGEITEGYLTADTLDMASKELRSQGMTPLKLAAGNQRHASESTSSAKGLSSNDVLTITAELSVLLKAGLPIDRSLKVMIDMSVRDEILELLNTILSTVKGGKGLSEALQQYQTLFGVFYISMIRSGEVSGRLAEVLEHLTEYLENAKEVRSSVVSALIYPAILLLVASLSIIVMLGFVVPQFETLFNDMGDALPLLTQGVIAAGDVIKSYGLIMIIALVIMVVSMQRWFKTAEGKEWLDGQLLKIPVLGNILFKFEIGKFSRAVGTLLGNGVSLLQALSIAVDTVENIHVKRSLDVLIPAVKGGGRISTAMEETKSFTPMVIQIIRVGEESGSLDKMMLELARVYDGEVQAGVSRSLKLLEPILILGMGGAIALIIISILMGILSVNDLAM